MTKAEELFALQRGDGCLAKSQDDEPVFILCARDVFAARLVREWADEVEIAAVRTAELTEARQRKIADARRLALAMDTWRAEHGGGKVPD